MKVKVKISSCSVFELIVLFLLTPVMIISVASAAVVENNVNVTGTGAPGYDVGQLGRQETEPSCKSNPLNELNIMCAYISYAYADLPEKQGDSVIGFSETRDGHKFIRRIVTGTRQHFWNGQDFMADPTMLASEGFAAITSIAGVRGGNSIMQIQRMMEVNTETGFKHAFEAGQIEIAAISGSNFIDKPDARIIPHPTGGTAPVTMTLEDGSEITRELKRIRILVTFAVFNNSNQNIRTYSIYSDEWGAPGTWSNQRQITQTTGLDQGLSVANIDDRIAYVVRRFEIGSEPASILGAVSRNGGERIGKVFNITEDTGFCPFDQVTLPDPSITQNAVSFRTNDFPWISATKHEYVLVYAEKPRESDGSCSTNRGSRVMVRSSKDGTTWSAPVEVSPIAGHGFQFMQSIDCGDEFCQALWYDTRNESLAFDAALQGIDQKHWEENPFIEDFNVNDVKLGLLRFRRTADVYTNRINIDRSANVPQPLPNANPERVSRYIVDNLGFEREFNLMNIRAFGGNTVPFDGDYISITALGDKSADKVNFFAAWTDWRNARGQLVDSNFDQPSPYEVSPDSLVVADAEAAPDKEATPDGAPRPDEPGLPTLAREIVAKAPATTDRFLSAYMPRAEGLDDQNISPPVCTPVTGDPDVVENDNRSFNTQTKNSEIFGAIIQDRIRLVSPTAAKNYDYCKIVEPSTGNCLQFAQIQRTFVLGINNDAVAEDEFGNPIPDENGNPIPVDKIFKLVIANQPGNPVQLGLNGDDAILVDARASWRQLPYGPVFDPDADPAPVVVETLTVPGKSFDYITLFVVSQSTDNPVTVLAYDDTDTLVAEITVNGISDAGDLVDPNVGADVRVEEVHNPELIQPDWSALTVEALNPAYRNPAYRNPAYRNPAYRNEAFQDTSVLDPDEPEPVTYDYELREPTELLNPALRNPAYRNDAPEAFVDVTFGVEGDINTITANNADFAYAGEELNRLDTQVIAWRSNEVDSLRNCGISQISEDTVIAAVNNPAYRNLAVADINNNLEGSIHFVTGIQEVTNVTIRIFGTVVELEALIEVPEGCDPSLEDCSALQTNLAWALSAQAANTADCRPGVPIEQCEISRGEELVIKDVIPPVFDPPLEDGTTFSFDATGSDPDSAATIDLVADLSLTAYDNCDPSAQDCSASEVGVTCYITDGGQNELPFTVPLGTSTAQCDTDPDGQGNVGTWTGFVVVEDNEAPVISIPAVELIAPPDNADGAIVNYLGTGAWPDPTAEITVSDNIFKEGYAYPTLSCEPASGTEFARNAPTTVECTSTDAGPCDSSNESCVVEAGFPDGHNVTTASFTVTVQDLEAPVISGVIDGFLPDVEEEATAVDTPVTLTPPTLSDDIDNSPTVTSDAPVPVEFPLGTTIITWTARDFSGNESTALQRIIIVDTTNPVVTVSFPDGNTQKTNSLSGKEVTFEVDIDDIFPLASTIMCSAAGSPVTSPALLPVGFTTVTCSAEDTSGNMGEGSATVEIVLEYLGSGISGKDSGKTGSSLPLVWSWLVDSAPASVAMQNILIDTESRVCPCDGIDPSLCPAEYSLANAVSAEDPGSSGIQLLADGSYQYNLQAVDPSTQEPLFAARPSTPYCFEVNLPTGEFQQKTFNVRP